VLTLDPAKLLIMAVVALLVLGPDKLPGAARKASALFRDLQRLRTSLHHQVHEAVGDHPLAVELTEARDSLVRLRAADPRQALYRSIERVQDDLRLDPAAPGTVGSPTGGPAGTPPSPVSELLAVRSTDVGADDPSQN
jgi:sec-independent protein translocase protein TatB